MFLPAQDLILSLLITNVCIPSVSGGVLYPARFANVPSVEGGWRWLRSPSSGWLVEAKMDEISEEEHGTEFELTTFHRDVASGTE